MILLLRFLAHLVAFLLLLALAVVGLAVAVFSIGAGEEGLSLPRLATLVRLPELEGLTASFLGGVEGGALTDQALAAGAIAVLASILLLIGALVRPTDRVMVLSDASEGRLVARRRALGHAVAATAERARGVTSTRVKVKPKRRGVGGRVEVVATHSRRADPAQIKEGVSEAVGALIGEARSLKVRTRPEPGEAGERAE